MIQIPAETSQALLLNIATNLRKCRLELGLSQEGLADLCGYHRTYIGGIERAERNITIATLCALAKSLNLSASDLLKDPDEVS
jgi:transcriptional regulator with XRE-family HTH domain